MTNKTELFLKINDEWKQVDLSDNVPFPITFNIADVREINNRNGSYSKSLVIPGTKNNNQLFEYIFDIQSVGNYDTRIKVKAFITVETIPVMEGYLQLNEVSCDDNKYWNYNCVIFGENANFSKELLDNKLENLDFSELNHTFDLATATASWYGEWNTGYHYSMIDYNYNFSINDPLISLPLNFFRPNLYAKTIWDKIFSTTSFSYESNFLNSDLFKSLIITTNQQKHLNSESFRFNNTFRVGLTGSTSNFYAVIAYDPMTQQPDASDNIFTPTIVPFADDTTSPNGDPGSVFNTSTYKYINSSVYKKQKFGLNVDFKVVPYYMDVFSVLQPVDITNPTNIAFLNNKQLRIDVNLYRSKNPLTGTNQETLVSRYTIYNAGDDPSVSYSYGNVNYTSSQVLDTDIKRRYESPFFEQGNSNVYNSLYTGENIYYKVQVRTFGGDDNVVPVGGGPLYWKVIFNQTEDAFDDTKGTYIFNYVDSDIQIGQELDIKSSVPLNIKQVDFITSIVKMFNLYIMPDKIDPMKLIIEPRDDFYYETEYLDWSNKLDVSKDILQDPIVDERLRITLTHKNDSDFYNTDYTNRTNRIYGDKQFLTGNEFSNSDIKVETIFSPTILTPIRLTDGGISTTIVLPKIWSKETIEDSDKNKATGNIRILQRSSNPISTNGTSYQIEGTSMDVYPFVGNLNDPLNPTYDINFDNPQILYYSGFTPTINNLWNLFYDRYSEEIYGKESKLITCYIYLTPQDILDFDYRKQIYMDNISSGSSGYFRVNKIEYDPFNRQSYRVELIKILNNRKSEYNKLSIIGDTGVTLPPNSGVSVVSPGKGNQWTSDIGVVVGKNNISRSDVFNIVGDSNIIGAQSNNILLSGKGNIIGDGSPNSFVVGGKYNSIDSNSRNSGIIGGNDNRIAFNPSGTASSFDSDNNIIIGGSNNAILQGVTHSIVLGGSNFTATQSNSIYLNGNVYINGQTFSGGTSSATPIPVDEIAFGTGTNITSSPELKYDSTDNSLVQGSTNAAVSSRSNVLGGTNNNVATLSSGSSIIGGENNTIDASDNSIITSSKDSNVKTSSTLSSVSSTYNSTVLGAIRSAILGGTNNNLSDSSVSSLTNNSLILGGDTNTIDKSNDSVIIGGLTNTINNSAYQSSIIGAQSSQIYQGGQNDTIIGGASNIIRNYSNQSSIIGGASNLIRNYSNQSSIISSQNGDINGASRSSIIAQDGGSNITGGGQSFMIGSTNNFITTSYDSGIISSPTSILNSAVKSVVIGGYQNNIYSTTSGIILGGNNNLVGTGIQNSIIINGVGISLTQSDTTYIGGTLLLNGTEIILSPWYSEIVGGRNTINPVDYTLNPNIVGYDITAATVSINEMYSKAMYADNIIYNSSPVAVYTVTYDIGTWDLSAVNNINVSAPAIPSYLNVMSVTGIIHSDSGFGPGFLVYAFDYTNASSTYSPMGIQVGSVAGTTTINISAANTYFLNQAAIAYNSTANSRGWITVTYRL